MINGKCMSWFTKYFVIVFLALCYAIGCLAFKIELIHGIWMFMLPFLTGLFVAAKIEKYDMLDKLTGELDGNTEDS
jgi:hypothetical protein